jgi:putative thioredoxin
MGNVAVDRLKARPCYWLCAAVTKEALPGHRCYRQGRVCPAPTGEEQSVIEDAIFNSNYEDFDEVVVAASRHTPIIVDFWADWCAPCHAIAPQLTRVVEEMGGGIRLAKVEVDAGENMRLAGHYRLRGFPTVMLFEDGRERGRFSGSRPAHWIEHWITEHLAG